MNSDDSDDAQRALRDAGERCVIRGSVTSLRRAGVLVEQRDVDAVGMSEAVRRAIERELRHHGHRD